VKVRLAGLERQGGGPAANAAVCLARLGARTAFLGAVGGDALGASQIEELAREGVDVSGAVALPHAPAFVSFVLVDESDGARTIFSSVDDRPLLPAPPPPLPTPRPDLVLTDGWAGPAGTGAARAAHEEGIPVLLDAGSLRPEILELLGACEVAIVSLPFAAALEPSGTPEDALRELLSRGPRLAAVTLGENGVLAGAAGTRETFRVPAFRVPVRDTTGAGDAFHGGCAWALLKGLSFEESLRVGCAVAALKCRSAGARAGLPLRAELEAFLASLTEKS
jgi:sugar/nucleoside kinase (ribokinase family)